jgi:hypothetical protein
MFTTGDTTISVERGEWEQHLMQLGFGVPPSWTVGPGATATTHSSWADAERRLEPARRQLRAGEGSNALQSALKEFEAIVTAPYNPDSWKSGQLVPMPEQKRDGVIRALSGLCTYLNKVGHHRSQTERNEQGYLEEMPVDQWEAELVLGGAQFLLAVALRLKAP